MRTVYIGNLPISVAEEELLRLFVRHGVVNKAHVVTSPGTGVSKGYAFVEMKTLKGSRAAVKALNGLEIAGKRLEVTIARPRRGRAPGPADDPDVGEASTPPKGLRRRRATD